MLRGDCIRVSNSAEKVEPITVYIGYVHRVELDSVTLGFSKRSALLDGGHSSAGNPADVPDGE